MCPSPPLPSPCCPAAPASFTLQAITTLDGAVLSDVREHYRTPEARPYPDSAENPLLGQLNKLLEASGMSDPLAKVAWTSLFKICIYITPPPLSNKAPATSA